MTQQPKPKTIRYPVKSIEKVQGTKGSKYILQILKNDGTTWPYIHLAHIEEAIYQRLKQLEKEGNPEIVVAEFMEKRKPKGTVLDLTDLWF